MKPFNKILFLSFVLLLACPYAVADDSAPVQSGAVKYVVTHATVVPVREEPSHAAEQATQLLFGELCEVVERIPSWTKIRSTIDGQVGWVTSGMFTPVANNPSPISNSPSSMAVIFTPFATATPVDGGAPLLLTLGTRLPQYADGTFTFLGQQYLIDSACVNVTTAQRSTGAADLQRDLQRSDLITIAKSLLNTPYHWGGKNAMGLDCSGFAQVVYAAIGINILRNAREQITQGELVPSLSDALPGDLAFFDQDDYDPNDIRITHVGILLSPTEIIHCAGPCVHIDRIDASGIYLPDGTKTHHLVQIKRYL